MVDYFMVRTEREKKKCVYIMIRRKELIIKLDKLLFFIFPRLSLDPRVDYTMRIGGGGDVLGL
jgi:hypothetical protein